jgi:hypothetical protein
MPTTGTMTALAKQLRALEEQLARRRVLSRDELVGLLVEAFREHGRSGRTYSRADVLNRYELGCPTEVELFDFVVTVLGPDACLLISFCDGNEAPARRT